MFRNSLIVSLKIQIMIGLSKKMEIAFYNVIDHRCDKAEELNAPTESICKNITDYTEKFISSHEMPEAKAKELRDFTACIVWIYRTYPIG